MKVTRSNPGVFQMSSSTPAQPRPHTTENMSYFYWRTTQSLNVRFLWAGIEIISHSFHHGDHPVNWNAGDARLGQSKAGLDSQLVGEGRWGVTTAFLIQTASISSTRARDDLRPSSGSHQVNKQSVFTGLQRRSVLIRAPVSLYSIFQTNYFIWCRSVCSRLAGLGPLLK